MLERIALQPDGKIIASGVMGLPGGYLDVARFLPSGQPGGNLVVIVTLPAYVSLCV